MIAAMPFYREKGSTLRVYEIAKILGQQYDVDLVTYSQGLDKKIFGVTHYRTVSWYKPDVGVGQVSASKIILDFLLLVKCLVLVVRNKYDVIHAEDFEAAFIARILITFDSKKKFVYDLHNRIIDVLALKKKIPAFVEKILNSIEYYIVSRCDLIVLNWGKYADSPVFAKKKTFLYYDQIDISAQEPYQIETSRPYLVYSGNFEAYQGILEFLKVYEGADTPYDLVLVGQPSVEVENFVNANDLSDKIKLTGRLSIAQSNYVIAHATAAILPRLEGSSMKVIHYLMLGKPVIAKNTSSNRELLMNGRNALLYNGDAGLVQILNVQMSELLLSEGAATNIGNSISSIQSNWDKNRFISAYESVLTN